VKEEYSGRERMLGGVEILGEEEIYSGKKVTLRKLLLKIRGHDTFHEIIRFGESVAILPFITGSEVILIRQFRGAIGGWIIEIPAGRVEKGESPTETCIRELIEEIGYRPKSLEKLASCYLTPGYSDELIHLYVARDLEYVGQRLEEHEAIRLVRINYEDLLRDVLSGKINDAKTMLTVLFYEMRKRGHNG